MTRPYEATCRACGAPPERVTKKHWCSGHKMYVDGKLVHEQERSELVCEVCGKRWAEEVKPPEVDHAIHVALAFEWVNNALLADDDIKALQEALGSDETSASVLVNKAVRYIEGQQRAIELDRDRLLGFIEENHRIHVAYHKMKTWRDTLAGDRKTLLAENQKLRDEVAGRRSK